MDTPDNLISVLLLWVWVFFSVGLLYYVAKYFRLRAEVRNERELAERKQKAEDEAQQELYRQEPYAFTKRPVKIHAARLMDIDEEDGIALQSRTFGDPGWPDWFVKAFNKGDITVGKKGTDPVLYVKTLEGEHVIRVGMWILCGVEGEIYGCQNDIFLKTHE